MFRRFALYLFISIAVILACSENSTDPVAENQPIVLRVPLQYATIQEAIDAASDGDTVMVADGSYSGTGNRNINLNGKALVLRSQNGAENTIIDIAATFEDNYRAFIFNSGERHSSVIDGFTIRNGYGYVTRAEREGGAIYIRRASPLIRNCIFEDNSGDKNGGAIAAIVSSLKIENCVFIGNFAEYGAAIYISGLDNDQFEGPVTPSIKGCSFEHNFGVIGEGFGGAIYIQYGNMVLEIEDCLFTGNSSGAGGAIGAGFNSSVMIDNCTFYDNSGKLGSAVYLFGNRPDTITNTIMAFNNGGAALECNIQNNMTITKSNLYRNQGGDWTGCVAFEFNKNYNIWSNPRFCDPESGDFTLMNDSPCSADNNASGELIGAFEVGCSR